MSIPNLLEHLVCDILGRSAKRKDAVIVFLDPVVHLVIVKHRHDGITDDIDVQRRCVFRFFSHALHVTDVFVKLVEIFFEDRSELDESVSTVLIIVLFGLFTQSRKKSVVCFKEVIKGKFEISRVSVFTLHGLDCLYIIAKRFFIESDTEHVLGSILELVSFVDNHQPARTQDVACRSARIFTAFQRGEKHIVVGYLVIKITALGFVNIICVTAHISIFAFSARALDAYLFLDGGAKVEFVKINQSFGIVQGIEFLNRSLILLELGNLFVVFLISSLAEVVFLAFAEGYGKRSSDNSELLKHLRKVWNFLFYDSFLKLNA